MTQEQTLKLEQPKFEVVVSENFLNAKEYYYIFDVTYNSLIKVIKVKDVSRHVKGCDVLCESQSGKRFMVDSSELYSSEIFAYNKVYRTLLLNYLVDLTWRISYQVTTFLNKLRR